MSGGERGCRVGVDIGGTFTDVAVVDSTGALQFGKRLTVHGSEDEGVLAAVADTGVEMADVSVLAHGTTLVVNSLLERRGSCVALVTTRGFRDVHEMGRQSRPVGLDPFYRREPPLVPRDRRFEIDERVSASGEIERRPLAEEVEALIPELVGSGITAVAVAFLNSYVNSSNEDEVAQIISEALPDAFVTTSSSLSRLWREYERFTTAAANAYVGDPIATYLTRLSAGFAAQGFGGRFMMLDSTGGALREDIARLYPIRLVESGPVGGVTAARDLTARLGIDRAVTFDMGGTTAKSCLVENGQIPTVDLYWIGGYDRGFPIQVPTIDIIEVGSGGGSIAWVDDGGRLRVGPRSAGASPGPACYGRGGEEPTVTDAHVYCGHLSKQLFRAEISIQEELAALAIERLAGRLKMRPRRLALGILRLADLSMSSLIRRQTIERGRDPRQFAMVAFGGAGPLHACQVAGEAGINHVIIPPAPGYFSAFGMLAASLRLDRRVTFRVALSDLIPDVLRATLNEIRADILQQGRFFDASPGDFEESYALSMRYVGQEHSVLVRQPLPGLDVPSDAAERLRRLFEEEYELRFGHRDELSDIEIVDLTVVVEEVLPRRELSGSPAFTGEEKVNSISACFGEDERTISTDVIPRGQIAAADVIRGPAIIYENGSSTLVPPGWVARSVEGKNLSLTSSGYEPK